MKTLLTILMVLTLISVQGADTRISDLQQATTIDDSDRFLLTKPGSNRTVQWGYLKAQMDRGNRDNSLGVIGAVDGFVPLRERAPVPWLGWNSYWSLSTSVSLTGVCAVADLWATNGMLAAGYDLLCLDTYWNANTNAPDGSVVPDPVNFPTGMTPLTTYLHNKGFRVGGYISMTPLECDTPAYTNGGYGYEFLVARQFDNWGFDFMKLDRCGSEAGLWGNNEIPTRTWFEAFSYPNVKRSIALLASEFYTTRYLPTYLNAWQSPHGLRVGNSSDTAALFQNIMNAIRLATNAQVTMNPGADVTMMAGDGILPAPGAYRDLFPMDANAPTNTIVVGLSTLASFVAPVLLQNNPTAATLRYLTNREVLNVLQDPDCNQCRWTNSTGAILTFMRQLSDGSQCFFLLNTNATTTETITLTWADYGLNYPVAVRDLWLQTNLLTAASSYAASLDANSSTSIIAVASQSCRLLRVWQRPNDSLTESGSLDLSPFARKNQENTFTANQFFTGNGSFTNGYLTTDGSLAGIVIGSRASTEPTRSWTWLATTNTFRLTDSASSVTAGVLQISNVSGTINFNVDPFFNTPTLGAANPWNLHGIFFGNGASLTNIPLSAITLSGNLLLTNGYFLTAGTTAGIAIRSRDEGEPTRAWTWLTLSNAFHLTDSKSSTTEPVLAISNNAGAITIDIDPFFTDIPTIGAANRPNVYSAKLDVAHNGSSDVATFATTAGVVAMLVKTNCVVFPTNSISTPPVIALGSFGFWNSNGFALWKIWNTNGTTDACLLP